MKHRFLLLSAFLALAMFAAACAPQASTTVAPTEAVLAQEAVSTEAAMPMDVSIKIGQSDKLGSFLVDGDGKSLYAFLKDAPNMSNCYDECAQIWPPLLIEGAPVASHGVDAGLFGTTERTDGSLQVTYSGKPLYYFATDLNPGEVNGQGVKDVWFVISPAGETVMPAKTLVNLGENDELGSFLVDENGMSLYAFLKDAPNMSNCYDECAQIWPPLLTEGAPVAGDDLDAALLGTTERTDGALQVTYNGLPLYYFATDLNPGEVNGQGVKDVWFVVSPTGETVMPVGTLVNLGENDELGSYLVDENGMSLYAFLKDAPDMSNCYDECAQIWPPLLTEGAPAAGDGLDAGLFGTTERTDGSLQVTYSGKPLYYFATDLNPGEVNGQGVKDVWFVVSEVGELIK